MSLSERLGGEEPTLDVQLAALAFEERAAVNIKANKKAGKPVVHTLQDQMWEQLREDVILPRADVWQNAISRLRERSYDHMDEPRSRGNEGDGSSTSFYWRFGHHDAQKELEVTTDIGLYVYEPELTSPKKSNTDLAFAYDCVRDEYMRKRCRGTLLGVKPSEGVLGFRHVPKDELQEAFSLEMTDLAFALSAQVYGRQLGQKKRKPLANAAAAIQRDDQEDARPYMLKHNVAKDILKFHPGATFADVQNVLGETVSAIQSQRRRIDPLFNKFAGILDFLDRNDSKPMSTKDKFHFLAR